MLLDNHGRKINYLRLAVTDRCNLRCFYCMPEHGNDWLSREALMSYEEMLQICSLLVNRGIQKIRITGGEPFVRKDIMAFLSDLSKLKGLEELTLTTNGILTAPYVPELKKIGVKSVNLSLDTLDRNRFFEITRRDELPKVLETLDQLLKHDLSVKINAVVMEGKNTEDIASLVYLAQELPVSVRFIEEMPFNGSTNTAILTWDHVRILDKIKEQFPGVYKVPDPAFSTAYTYQIPGFKGTVGIIAAYTRSFCGTCNRLRLTPEGNLQTCLYGDSVLNLKDLLREGKTEFELIDALENAIGHRAKDGWEAGRLLAEKKQSYKSMARIGG